MLGRLLSRAFWWHSSCDDKHGRKLRAGRFWLYARRSGPKGSVPIFQIEWGFSRRNLRKLDAWVGIGGEDSMVKPHFALLGMSVWLGFKLMPASWMKPFVYQGRRTGFSARWGSGPAAWFLWDDDLANMHGYYVRKGWPDWIPRMARWPGLKFAPNWFKVRSRLLGRTTVVKEPVREVLTVVPMPEALYPCRVLIERWRWERARVPRVFQRVALMYEVFLVEPIPVPGKGENSWDCDDDAIYSLSGRMKFDSVAIAVAETVEAALRSRERHGGIDWRPRTPAEV